MFCLPLIRLLFIISSYLKSQSSTLKAFKWHLSEYQHQSSLQQPDNQGALSLITNEYELLLDRYSMCNTTYDLEIFHSCFYIGLPIIYKICSSYVW